VLGWAGRRSNRKAASADRFSDSNFGCGLDAFDVLCLPALGALDYVELNLLTFLQAAKTIGLDSGEVHEYVLAILAADKTVAFSIVKPLYSSCFHEVAVFLWLNYALKLAGSMQIRCGQVTLWSGVLLDSRKVKRT
jgi:hypothetical protein